MSERDPELDPAGSQDSGAGVSDPESYGSLTVEDDPGGTVDPADLAGTADSAGPGARSGDLPGDEAGDQPAEDRTSEQTGQAAARSQAEGDRE
jgi:hypothetical protein